MELCETKALGRLDDHDGCMWHIDSHLDHRGRYKNLEFTGFEVRHHLILLLGFHFAMHESDTMARIQLLHLLIDCERIIYSLHLL